MTYREIRRPLEQTGIHPDFRFVAMDEAKHRHIGWILIVGNDTQDEIKIGYGKDLRRRLEEYRKTDIFGSSEVHLLAAVRGTEAEEERLHTYFADELNRKRRKTEFFHVSERLTDYLAYLRSYYFVCCDESEAYSGAQYSDRAIAVEPQIWLPDPSRRRTERRPMNLFSQTLPWYFLPGRSVSQGDEYFTPVELLEPARLALGGFDLDPASQSEVNDARVKATYYYTREQDGLARPWFGRIWVNPPFSLWPEFSQKALDELDRGDITGMVMLANSRTVTALYFEPLLRRSVGLCVVHGRYSFDGILHSAEGSPSNGQIMVLVKGDYDRFRDAYQSIGSCFRR